MKNVLVVIVQSFLFKQLVQCLDLYANVVLFDDLIDNCLLIERVNIAHAHVVR
jgi:hypothetical protein